MHARLTDGTEVDIREIRASDKAMLASGYGRLSEISKQKRFLAPKPQLSSSELRYLTELDGIDHYAIVAVPADRWDGEIVAVARFVREVGEPTTAEAAIVVCDGLQNKGLGKRLAAMLADAARRRGVRRIKASIYSDNPPAHRLMEIIASRLTDGGHDHGVHEVTAELAA
jgi:GNAT superfamily N-acetyltransferase